MHIYKSLLSVGMGFFITLSGLTVLAASSGVAYAADTSETTRLNAEMTDSSTAFSTTYCTSSKSHGNISLSVRGDKISSIASDVTANPIYKATSGYKAQISIVGVYTNNVGVYGKWKTWHYGYIENGQVGWIYDGLKTVSCYYTASV